jgi:uncharacterized protein (TIGR03118 family)
MRIFVVRLISTSVALFIAAGTGRAGGIYVQTNLVTSDQGVVKAQQTDPNLINPWGMAFSTTSPLWVSNQASGMATVYKITGTSSSPNLLTVPVQNQGGAPPSDNNGPTGQVSTGAPGVTTGSSDFQVSGGKAAFIFDNLDGSISAWRFGLSQATIVQSLAGASFTGLAIGNTSGGAAQLYAADQNSTNVFVYNSSFTKIGALVDPNGIPAGFTAFNVQNIGGTLFVTYANPNNPLGGVVDEYTTDGAFIKRLIDDAGGTHLDTPWGLAVAPSGWGKFGGDLLVGNNDGDGTVNAYNLNGVWQGQLTLGDGTVFSQGELWALHFGSGGGFGSPNVLYFDAGLPGATAGLIGAISAVPEPSSIVLGLIAMGVVTGCWRWRNRRKSNPT